MAATFVDLNGYAFGITSNETGMNVESVSHKATSKKIEVPNKDGDTTGLVYHDPKVEISISGPPPSRAGVNRSYTSYDLVENNSYPRLHGRG